VLVFLSDVKMWGESYKRESGGSVDTSVGTRKTKMPTWRDLGAREFLDGHCVGYYS
jgi:hypothetical protein